MHVYMAFRSGRACACLTAYAHGQRLLGVNIYDITLHSVECGKNALSFAIKKKKHIYKHERLFGTHCQLWKGRELGTYSRGRSTNPMQLWVYNSVLHVSSHSNGVEANASLLQGDDEEWYLRSNTSLSLKFHANMYKRNWQFSWS